MRLCDIFKTSYLKKVKNAVYVMTINHKFSSWVSYEVFPNLMDSVDWLNKQKPMFFTDYEWKTELLTEERRMELIKQLTEERQKELFKLWGF